MTDRFRRTFAAVVAAAGCTTFASAQTASRPPAGVVYAGARPSGAETLSISVDAAEAYDQDIVPPPIAGANLPVTQPSGFYTLLVPQLTFDKRGDRLHVAAAASSDLRYYDELHRTVTAANAGAFALDAQITPRTSFGVTQAVGYSPTVFSGLFSGAPPAGAGALPPPSRYVLESNPSYRYTTTALVAHNLSTRAAVVFDSGFQYTDFTRADAGYADVSSAQAGGRLTYSVSRDLTLRLGYTLRRGQYIGSPALTEHIADIGVMYVRPLSRTRKTSLSFTLGPSTAAGPLLAGRSDTVRQQFRLVGDAALSRQFARTWTAHATYHRGVGYIEGFQAPVFTSAYVASANGFLSRRADVSLTATYSSGEPALSGVVSPFNTYSGDARLRIALARTWAAYVEYLYYDYRFTQGLELPDGIPGSLTRNGIRLGLTLWIPVRSSR